MRFSIATVATVAGLAQAVVLPAQVASDSAVEKRDVLVTLLTTAATDLIGDVIEKAVNAAANEVTSISDSWDASREQFTQVTVEKMWDTNPNTATYGAAVCYNKSYSLKDSSLMSNVTSVELKSGLLHTDYDCFYMNFGNTFYRESDGGYQNYAAMYSDSCTYDSSTGSVEC